MWDHKTAPDNPGSIWLHQAGFSYHRGWAPTHRCDQIAPEWARRLRLWDRRNAIRYGRQNWLYQSIHWLRTGARWFERRNTSVSCWQGFSTKNDVWIGAGTDRRVERSRSYAICFDWLSYCWKSQNLNKHDRAYPFRAENHSDKLGGCNQHPRHQRKMLRLQCSG